MKKLIISMKPTDEMFSDFINMSNKIKKNKTPKKSHYEISFESQVDFNRFIKNIGVLIAILNQKPHSIYQLAKLTNRDLANIKKVVNFFEEIGAISIKERTVSGRKVKTPIVEYDKIEFDLKAAWNIS